MENSMKTLYIFRIRVHPPEPYRAGFLRPGPDPMTDSAHYTNHLITETSPSLLQHAYNPGKPAHSAACIVKDPLPPDANEP